MSLLMVVLIGYLFFQIAALVSPNNIATRVDIYRNFSVLPAFGICIIPNGLIPVPYVQIIDIGPTPCGHLDLSRDLIKDILQ